MAAAKAEYANLRAALSHALRTSQSLQGIIGPLDEYLDQAQQHDTRRQLLDQAIAAYPGPASRARQLELAQLHGLAGHTALTRHRPGDADAHYRIKLQLQQAAGDHRGQAFTYHQLGRVAQEQRRFAEAEAACRQALEIFLEFGDRHSAAGTYHQLGREKGLVFFPKRLAFDLRTLTELSLDEVYADRLATIVSDGLARIDGDCLRLTDAGKPLYSELMVHFFSDAQARLYERMCARLRSEVGVIDEAEWAAGVKRVRRMGAFNAMASAGSRRSARTAS